MVSGELFSVWGEQRENINAVFINKIEWKQEPALRLLLATLWFCSTGVMNLRENPPNVPGVSSLFLYELSPLVTPPPTHSYSSFRFFFLLCNIVISPLPISSLNSSKAARRRRSSTNTKIARSKTLNLLTVF